MILEAAQRRVVEGGPEALRLQDVAKDVGVSHPAILHHFGSREGLIRELVQHALASLEQEVLGALAGAEDLEPAGLIRRIRDTLGNRGHARLLAWLELSGWRGTADGAGMLSGFAEALHRRRVERAGPGAARRVDFEDSRFAVQLVAVALLGDALFGDRIRRSAGDEDPAREEFQEKLSTWLQRGLAPSTGSGNAEGLPADD